MDNLDSINHKIIPNAIIYITYLLCQQTSKLYQSAGALCLAPLNETITHKGQNELSFSISSDMQSDVVPSQYVTIVWPPESLPVKKLRNVICTFGSKLTT
jgi:hypothetical protein